MAGEIVNLDLSEPEEITASIADFAALYGTDPEFSGSKVIALIQEMARKGEIMVDFSVPGVKITFLKSRASTLHFQERCDIIRSDVDEVSLELV